MYLCRSLTDASFPQIGDQFGGRDHTTVIHSVEKMEREIQTDLELAAVIEMFTHKFDSFR